MDDFRSIVEIFDGAAPVGIISIGLLFHTLIEDHGWTADILDFHSELVGNGIADFEGQTYEIVNKRKGVTSETS